MTTDELIVYYTNLLIVQFRGQPKARATITALVTQAVADSIFMQARDSFDIDKATGLQLDLIGRLVGVSRYYYTAAFPDRNYLSFQPYSNWSGGAVVSGYGFSTYAALDVPQYAERYSDLIDSLGTLSDIDYRKMLRYQIKINTMNVSLENIDDLLWTTFGLNPDGDNIFYAEDNMNMTMNIHHYTHASTDNDSFIQAVRDNMIFPKMAGVAVALVVH